jgi:mannitol-1-phosphate 5-dehydrogenase
MDLSKKIVILGAGKIGRGFIADIFQKSGYKIAFIDSNAALIEQMNLNGKYTLFNVPGLGEEEKKVITGFEAYHIDDIKTIETLEEVDLAAVCLFPAAFDDTAELLAKVARKRYGKKMKCLDVLVCANMFRPAHLLREKVIECLKNDEEAQSFISFIETIVIRIAIDPKPEMVADDPLVVQTNGYPWLYVEQDAFMNTLPKCDQIAPSSNMLAEETRKIYTYNMTHAVLAYVGLSKGLVTVHDALNDSQVRRIADGALEEISTGLQLEFGFTADEMKQWNSNVIKNFSNPLLIDRLDRVGFDPIRKLQRDDRLTGAALLCRKNGVYPIFLASAIAYGLKYCNELDPSSLTIAKTIEDDSLSAAIEKFCGLKYEKDLIALISDCFAGEFHGMQGDDDRIQLIKLAYYKGFEYEKNVKGCAQCLLLSMFDVANNEDAALFQAASGFSGGMALCGDGACGGYSGGILFMSSKAGRRLIEMKKDGDKKQQYISYETAQKLHDRFVKVYGGVTCAEVHRSIFGRDYCLRTKEVRDEFELAGGHKDKCTCVVAAACAWVTEILLDQGLL